VKIRDRIVELRRVPAGSLLPNPKNWRRHPKSQADALRGLLSEIGYADALVARETPDGLMLIDGHLRAETTPDAVVPVLVLDVTEEEADKLLLTLDPLAAMAEADSEALAALLKSVASDSEAVRAMLEGLARDAGIEHNEPTNDVDADPQIGRGEELREKWGVEPGQVWHLGGHHLICGDSTDIAAVKTLMKNESAACMWTDAPYGVDYVGGTAENLSIENDNAEGIPELLSAAFSIADQILVPGAPIYVCHPAGPLSVVFGKAFIDAGWRFHQTLVWVKSSLVLGHSDYHYRHEPILYGWKGKNRPWYGSRDQTSVLEFDKPARNELHPTIKPVELVDACLKNSTERRDVVYEPFAGSGTTLISCERLGRKCRAMEISPAYAAVTLQRWADATGKQPTLAESASWPAGARRGRRRG
jgi:DNA modification methylase